jgi:hypothetical protein
MGSAVVISLGSWFGAHTVTIGGCRAICTTSIVGRRMNKKQMPLCNGEDRIY